MTEKKRYTMVNTNLVDNDGVYYLIKKEGHDFCQVFGENTAKAIVNELNNLYDMRIENGKIASAYLKENEQLKSIKNFAERNGINIFKIDEAFRKCWADNSKLTEENKRLKNIIKEAYNTERTKLGKSVLKQLLERIQ